MFSAIVWPTKSVLPPKNGRVPVADTHLSERFDAPAAFNASSREASV